jgi:hypothetical protein
MKLWEVANVVKVLEDWESDLADDKPPVQH